MGEGQIRIHAVNWDCPSAVCVCPVTMNDMEEGPNEVAGWVNCIPGWQYLPARILSFITTRNPT